MTTTPDVTRRHRALIVEDDPAIRRLVGKLLQRRGIDIDVANDGKQAIEKIRRGGYSVLILDLMVPEVNGFEIIDFVRKNSIRTPVAVVSARPLGLDTRWIALTVVAQDPMAPIELMLNRRLELDPSVLAPRLSRTCWPHAGFWGCTATARELHAAAPRTTNVASVSDLMLFMRASPW